MAAVPTKSLDSASRFTCPRARRLARALVGQHGEFFEHRQDAPGSKEYVVAHMTWVGATDEKPILLGYIQILTA